MCSFCIFVDLLVEKSEEELSNAVPLTQEQTEMAYMHTPNPSPPDQNHALLDASNATSDDPFSHVRASTNGSYDTDIHAYYNGDTSTLHHERKLVSAEDPFLDNDDVVPALAAPPVAQFSGGHDSDDAKWHSPNAEDRLIQQNGVQGISPPLVTRVRENTIHEELKPVHTLETLVGSVTTVMSELDFSEDDDDDEEKSTGVDVDDTRAAISESNGVVSTSDPFNTDTLRQSQIVAHLVSVAAAGTNYNGAATESTAGSSVDESQTVVTGPSIVGDLDEKEVDYDNGEHRRLENTDASDSELSRDSDVSEITTTTFAVTEHSFCENVNHV